MLQTASVHVSDDELLWFMNVLFLHRYILPNHMMMKIAEELPRYG